MIPVPVTGPIEVAREYVANKDDKAARISTFNSEGDPIPPTSMGLEMPLA
jgi:hypothetical protein